MREEGGKGEMGDRGKRREKEKRRKKEGERIKEKKGRKKKGKEMSGGLSDSREHIRPSSTFKMVPLHTSHLQCRLG